MRSSRRRRCRAASAELIVKCNGVYKKVNWPFDQAQNVATITTRRVMEEGYPVLSVVHYSDDDSWAFTCGTTNDSKDMMLVSMEEVISRDASLFSIADLPPGWGASREAIGSKWVKYKHESI